MKHLSKFESVSTKDRFFDLLKAKIISIYSDDKILTDTIQNTKSFYNLMGVLYEVNGSMKDTLIDLMKWMDEINESNQELD